MFQNKFQNFLPIFQNGIAPSVGIYLQKRNLFSFFEWFVRVFNGVDRERLKLVGPDCACAEWLLRNGASVRFKGHCDLLSDYNELIALENTGAHQFKLEEIYARDAALHPVGFDHLQGCSHVKKVSLIFCTRLTDPAVVKLKYVRTTLEYLEIRSCFNIQDPGVLSIGTLSNLKTLILADLISVKKKDECEAALRKALPNCKIDFKKE